MSEGSEYKPLRIKYEGPSVYTRILTEKDFKDAGFDLKAATWSFENNHLVDVSEWPKEAIEFVIQLDGFSVA